MSFPRATRHALSLFVLLAGVLATACSASNAGNTGSIDGGAAPPSDGARGKCCAPSTGGCANTGGYREDGDCGQGALCDNMCEQKIVDDVHGCKKMVYKSPPVTTTYAGTGSCSDPAYNGGSPFGDDGGKDGGDGGPDAARDASGE